MSYTTPIVFTVSDPILLDKKIAEIQTKLSSLSWLTYSFARAYRHAKDVEGANVYYPAVYQGDGIDYYNCFPNDNLAKACSFVYVKQPQRLIDGTLGYETYRADISIIFFLRLKEIETVKYVQTSYDVSSISTKYIFLAVAEGDVSANFHVGDTIWPQGGTWNYPPTTAAIRTVVGAEFVSYFGNNVTRIDVGTYPESTDNTSLVHVDLTTIDTSDTYHFTEKIKHDIAAKLDGIDLLDIDEVFDEVEAAYADFTFSNIEAKFLKESYVALRFNCEIEYSNNCQITNTY